MKEIDNFQDPEVDDDDPDADLTDDEQDQD